MGKYKIVEVYNEKTVTTSTNSFDEVVMTYQDQIGGTSQPAKGISVYMDSNGEEILIAGKEL